MPLDNFRRDDGIGAGRFVGHWHATLLSSPEALNHATGNNSNIPVPALAKGIDANGASVQSLSHELGITLTINRRDKVKKTIIGLVCALVVPLAFAQTSTTTTEETTTTNKPITTTDTTTSTTYTTGAVTTYEPGKTIVVKSDEGPVSFALGTAARIVDGAGKVVTAPLRAGQKVRVYYAGPTEHRTVERVIVED
jgi:hypothetical protein